MRGRGTRTPNTGEPACRLTSRCGRTSASHVLQTSRRASHHEHERLTTPLSAPREVLSAPPATDHVHVHVHVHVYSVSSSRSNGSLSRRPGGQSAIAARRRHGECGNALAADRRRRARASCLMARVLCAHRSRNRVPGSSASHRAPGTGHSVENGPDMPDRCQRPATVRHSCTVYTCALRTAACFSTPRRPAAGRASARCALQAAHCTLQAGRPGDSRSRTLMAASPAARVGRMACLRSVACGRGGIRRQPHRTPCSRRDQR